MKHLLICSMFFFGIALTGVAAEFKIDTDFPGGNVVSVEIDGDTVRFVPTQWWMTYWSFRVRGAEGRTLNFEIVSPVKGNLVPMATRGPAISNDNGTTWRWLGDKPGFSETKFQYVFGPDEKEVLISSHMNYTERDLKRFLKKYKDNANLKIETLCQSPEGRNVELLRIPGKGNDTDFKIFFSARHHSGETPPSYVLEGILEVVLSDSDDGKWLREHCDFFIVPFVDKDGVEKGNVGNDRKPHNHNRDYFAKVHPETRAITEQTPRWQNGKPIVWIDMHGTELRARPGHGRPENDMNESAYFVGSPVEDYWKKEQRLGKILEAERKGPIPYREAGNVKFGDMWNTPKHFGYADGNDLFCHCSRWAESTLSNIAFVSTLEMGYANAWGVEVNADALRFLGRDLARAFRVYLETLEKQQ